MAYCLTAIGDGREGSRTGLGQLLGELLAGLLPATLLLAPFVLAGTFV